MKIKEAARETGLTEKAIRFYEAKRLVTPEMREQNGRVFREYTEENLRTLTVIACLRRAFFSVEQIRAVLYGEEPLSRIFTEYRDALLSDYDTMTPLVDRIAQTDADALRSAADVVAAVSPPDSCTEAAPVPRELRFRRHEDLPEAEKEAAYRAFLARQARRDRRDAVLSFFGRGLKKCAAIAGVLAVLVLLAVILDNVRILHTYTETADGVEWREGDPAYTVFREVTFTVTERRYLFREDIVSYTLQADGLEEAAHMPLGYLYDPATGTHLDVSLLWHDETTRAAVFVLSETRPDGELGTYYYDGTEYGRMLAVGVTDRAEGQTLADYARLRQKLHYQKKIYK